MRTADSVTVLLHRGYRVRGLWSWRQLPSPRGYFIGGDPGNYGSPSVLCLSPLLSWGLDPCEKQQA